MGNIHVKLYEVWTSGLGGDVVKRYFLSGALAVPLFSGAEPFVQFSRGYYEKQFCEIYFEFGQMVPEEMSFKDISYLGLWWSFCSAEQNHLCKFGRGYQEEQFCEIILNMDQWFRRYHFKKSFLELWQPHCLVERNHLCNLERGHHGEHSYESK